MSLADEADALARELFEAKSKLRAAGRALHDHVGPLLSATGIGLDLLRADQPQVSPAVQPAQQALEDAMERVRSLSRELTLPPSAHLGLKKALSNLVESHAESFAGTVVLSYETLLVPPDHVTAAIYEAASAVFARVAGDRTATRISISVRGARNLTVRIESNGRHRPARAFLAAQARRAGPAEVLLDMLTKKSTIVSIYHVPGRPNRR